ncbi:phosphoribosyltransferase [Acidovorax cavernicola]|uniref:Phosphoribosyltransferase n=1 Tax=Acidovorax cavernicola TaxID=1675792 RepID=A0A9X8GT42_9BURK|nr:phosphoribosyltransferase [Acidovorax cavernicola]RIX75820.1 phosphoribosyltransferase [Acidovorax cavernicola]
MKFRDRADAGRQLAALLQRLGGFPDAMVLALPRGGVPVAFEVARALRLPLDVLVVRKLGLPAQPEYAFGALAGDGLPEIDDHVVRMLDLRPSEIDAVVRAERAEMARRTQAYRGDRPLLEMRGRAVLVIDDGLATGATMRAAVRGLRRQGAGTVIAAVPVGSPEACEALQREADDVVCVRCPTVFRSVGAWYGDFSQTTDDEVCALLAQARGDSA